MVVNNPKPLVAFSSKAFFLSPYMLPVGCCRSASVSVALGVFFVPGPSLNLGHVVPTSEGKEGRVELLLFVDVVASGVVCPDLMSVEMRQCNLHILPAGNLATGRDDSLLIGGKQ